MMCLAMLSQAQKAQPHLSLSVANDMMYLAIISQTRDTQSHSSLPAADNRLCLAMISQAQTHNHTHLSLLLITLCVFP